MRDRALTWLLAGALLAFSCVFLAQRVYPGTSTSNPSYLKPMDENHNSPPPSNMGLRERDDRYDWLPPFAQRTVPLGDAGDIIQTKTNLVPAVETARQSVSGKLSDEEGEPVSGAMVSALVPSDIGFLTKESTMSDADGGFSLTELSPGPVRIVVESGGFMTYQLDSQVPIPLLSIVLSRGVSIAGFVVDADGGGLLGAEVLADCSTTKNRPQADATLKIVQSGAGGKFQISGLKPGLCRLSFSRDSFGTVSNSSQRASTSVELEHSLTNVVLRFEEGETISGIVVDDRTGVALQATSIFVEPEGGGGAIAKRLTDTDGRFIFGGLSKGNYRISATLKGYSMKQKNIVTPSGEGLLSIEMVRGSVVRGRVTNSNLRPLSIFTVDGVQIADANGEFQVEVEFGRQFVVEAPGFAPSVVVLPGSSNREVDVGTVAMSEGRSLSGVVMSSAGDLLAHVLIMLRSSSDVGSVFLGRPVVTSSDGRFVIQQVPPSGTVKVLASLNGYQHAEVEARPQDSSVVIKLFPQLELNPH